METIKGTFEDMDIESSEKEESLPSEAQITIRHFHLKVVYNYQTVEFDFFGTLDDFLTEGSIEFGKVLAALQTATDSVIPPQTVVKQEKLASDKQKEIMDKFHIPYTDKTTSKQAQTLIEESIKAANS